MVCHCCGADATHQMPLCQDDEDRLCKRFPQAIERRDTPIFVSGIGETWIHSVELPLAKTAADRVPFVFIPGYGTGAAIFTIPWRHLVESETWSKSEASRRHLVAVDPLGWYLSGHPRWESGASVEGAEHFFTESLEAWRKERNFERIDLLGHSIGGNIASTYAERYPQRVRSLLLLSPAGMPGEPVDYRQKMRSAPWTPWLILTLWGRGWTPHYALKILPKARGQGIAARMAMRWGRGVPEGWLDMGAFADYIYFGWSEGAESGEHALGALLHPGAWGKRPLAERLLRLKVPRVELIYGDKDWMDVRHGNAATDAAERGSKSGGNYPAIFVQLLEGAGHYAHLEQPESFCAALQTALNRPTKCTSARAAPVPEGFGDRFSGPTVPIWRQWENYQFGR